MNEAVSAALETFDSVWCRNFRQSLERWYLRSARILPWRETSDPYRIWISEIMLQQTTVKAVVPYYERFLARFPNVESLAAASEAEVLKYWEGLGYYSRGRNLRRAAQQICEQHAGVFPEDLIALQALPGVGRYTAGAIRSFGFNLPAPIVEANTLRLYCRLLGYRGDPRSREGGLLLWQFAEQLQPSRQAGHLNQALMELGATICTPSAPRCEECPVSRFCRAFANQEQNEIPAPKARPAVTELVDATAAIQHDSRWLILQRGPGERWAGMWDFPRFSLDGIPYSGHFNQAESNSIVRQAMSQLQGTFALSVAGLNEVMQIRHTVTRYRIRLVCLQGELGSEPAMLTGGSVSRWASREELESLPMPVTGRRFVTRLQREV